MIKYSTPQIVSEADGIYKISSQKLKKCCMKTLEEVKLKPKQEVKCECGNMIQLEELQ